MLQLLDNCYEYLMFCSHRLKNELFQLQPLSRDADMQANPAYEHARVSITTFSLPQKPSDTPTGDNVTYENADTGSIDAETADTEEHTYDTIPSDQQPSGQM